MAGLGNTGVCCLFTCDHVSDLSEGQGTASFS